jgi:signal transduction histidine kinase/CheY-like chemotaxis protein
MTKIFSRQSMQTRLLGPLVILLMIFVVVFGFLTWSFETHYIRLQKQLIENSGVIHHTIEVMRTRARTQELLLLFRLNQDPKSLGELSALSKERTMHLDSIMEKTRANVPLVGLSESLLGGLGEAAFLQQEMIDAVVRKDMATADEAFRQLSTIFEINSARLKDFSMHLEHMLRMNQDDLENLVSTTFWILLAMIVAVAGSIWLIAVYYRRDVLKPMHALHGGLQDVARGEMNVRVPAQPAPFEIQDMIADFNKMIANLESAYSDLTAAREEALKSAQVKSDFLANMSHEIRTPMNTIIGMADVLSEAPLDAESRSYVKVLRSSGEVMLNVVNDILDFSKLESGVIALENSPFDLCAAMSRVSEVIRVTAERKGLAFIEDFDPESDCWVKGDAIRLEQVVLNLLGNAVKFTSQGQIEFKLRVRKENARAKIEIAVKDSGIGISPSDVEKIFARFSQSDSSVTRKFGGTGLGLAIVKQLVDIMKGEITVTSELGRGTTFSVRMNLEVAEPVVEKAPRVGPGPRPPLASSKKRLLLVDDSPDNRFLIETYLKNADFIISSAENGEMAYRLFTGGRFDVVLMDMQMPILDGYGATAKIRDYEASHAMPRTPIIALTAHVLKQEMERSRAVGCDLHVTKPVRKAELLEALDQVIT